MLDIWFKNVNILTGVGNTVQKLLNNIGCFNVRDLLFYLPHSYEERKYQPMTLGDKDKIVITAKILSMHNLTKKIYVIKVLYMSNIIELVFFTSPTYLYSYIKIGEFVGIIGEVTHQNNKYKIIHPQIISVANIDNIPRIMPIYSLTKGLSNNLLYKLVKQAIDLIENNAFDIKNILIEIHLLGDTSRKNQLISYEFVIYHLKMRILKACRERQKNQPIFTKHIFKTQLLASLSFQITNGQKSAIEQIIYDLQSTNQMSRLLQGDVGCGKTIVALISMLEVIENNQQAIIMAPTEILAQQHFATITNFCKNFTIKIVCLTGSTTKKNKLEYYQQALNGEIDIIIGTHSLLNEELLFKNLALIIIDEQHRFGVKQRQMLLAKNSHPNLLYMSATPIPRTMALALYGDMDITEITDKPSQRKAIITVIKSIKDDVSVIKALHKIALRGEKVYWICPQITENENSDLANVESRYKEINKYYPNKVLLLHSKISIKEKDKIMQDFIASDKFILVSTTVIEVGVDVPLASVIVIDQAERFGLAQLHQLRGRVGRSDIQSYCILLHGENLSAISKQRLTIMRDTENGFKIAQEDMKLRGAGDVFGTVQSGLPEFKIGNLKEHHDIFLNAYNREKNLTSDERENYQQIFTIFE